MTSFKNLISIKAGTLSDLLVELEKIDLELIGKIFAEALEAGNSIFWCGNGGSAAESSHLATELLGRFKNNRIPYPSISLNADTTLITCIANDFGYDEIYARQLEGLGKPGDLLVVLSTSGQSPNILRVLEEAKKLGVTSIALLGKGGGPALKLADHSLVVQSEETARIQEVHLLVGHTLCEYAEMKLGHL
jgi:D-sedoheptulose 7-phosphate isomerase